MALKAMAVQVILALSPQVHGRARPPPRPQPLGAILQGPGPQNPVTVVQNSRLLRLPPELRNTINSMVLLDELQDFRFAFHHYPSFPPLLQVCQQTRSDALCVYFQCAHFEFVIQWRGLRALLRYLDGLDTKAQVQLLNNKNFSVHVIYDSYHPRYNEMKRWLGKFSYADRHRGPYITAEDSKSERAAVDKMRSKSARVDIRAARIAAELQAITEKGADAVKLAKQAAKAVKHPGRVLLHRELGVVYDQITAILRPPSDGDTE